MKILIVAVCLLVCVFAKHDHGVQADDWKDGDDMVVMNFEDDCIEKINEMIHHSMESVFEYIAIAVNFRAHEADIVGMSLMFNAWSRIKLNSVKEMVMYIVKRGGTVTFKDVKKPEQTSWSNPADAFKVALKRERMLMTIITDLAKHAHEHGDAHLTAFIEKELVNPQVDRIFETASYINKFERGGAKFGLLAINTQMIKKYKDFKDCESDMEKFKWNY